jgi:transketolase
VDPSELKRLQEAAHRIRCHIVELLVEAKSGHPGGALSGVEYGVALYLHALRHDPKNPHWQGRDRVIWSRGHVGPLIFSLLAESGYIPVEELLTFRKFGSRLQGHPTTTCPGIEVGTGSLGQGLSVATGLALAFRMDGQNNRAYCLMGDGESQEGSVWEAIMCAGHYGLDNLCLVVDYNNLQIDGCVEDVIGLAPLADKYRAFRWNVIEVDGHDLPQLIAAYDEAAAHKGQPTVILAHTIKGKGVSFMENQAGWHGKAPSPAEGRQALLEMGCEAEGCLIRGLP